MCCSKHSSDEQDGNGVCRTPPSYLWYRSQNKINKLTLHQMSFFIFSIGLMHGESSRLHHSWLSPIHYVIYLRHSDTISAKTTINRLSTRLSVCFTLLQPATSINKPTPVETLISPLSHCWPAHNSSLHSTRNQSTPHKSYEMKFIQLVHSSWAVTEMFLSIYYASKGLLCNVRSWNLCETKINNKHAHTNRMLLILKNAVILC